MGYVMGFNAPSKIQETALPTLLADPPQNMIAQSQSGTGKTAAFVLAMLSRENTALVRAVVCGCQRCSWILFHEDIFKRLFGCRSFYGGATSCSRLIRLCLLTCLVRPPTICCGSHFILAKPLLDIAVGSTSI